MLKRMQTTRENDNRLRAHAVSGNERLSYTLCPRLAGMKRGSDHQKWEDDAEELEGDEVWLSTEET